jgi:hypothetical protein
MASTLSDELLQRFQGKPKWDGIPGASFRIFREKFQDHLVSKGISGYLFFDELGVPELKDSTEKGKLANAMTFSILRQAVPPDVMETIRVECDSDDAAAVKAGGTAGDLLLGHNSALLWEKVLKHSHGPLAVTAGFDLQEDIRSWNYPADPNLNHLELATKAFSQQTELVHRATNLGDNRYPYTHGHACAAILSSLPPFLAINKRSYRSFITLPTLGAEVRLDASEADKKPELVALMAALSTGSTNLAALVANPSDPIGKTRGAEKKPYVRVNHERRKDKASGPPWPTSVWCDVHGWCSHDSSTCKGDRKKQSSKPTALVAAAAAGSEPLYKQLPDGNFERVLMTKQLRVSNNVYGLPFSPCEYITPSPTPVSADTVLASSSLNLSALHPRCSITYVDCGGSIGIVRSIDTDGCIADTAVYFKHPRPIGGIGDSVSAIGKVQRALAISIPGSTSVIGFQFQAYICPKTEYEIVPTNAKGLSGTGISSKQDAQLPGCPLVLEPHHLPTGLKDNKLYCVPFQGLWALPTVPFPAGSIKPGMAQLLKLPQAALVTVPVGGVLSPPSPPPPPPGNVTRVPVGGQRQVCGHGPPTRREHCMSTTPTTHSANCTISCRTSC